MSRSADLEESVPLQQHLFQLFDSLEEHLLSSTLTPLDVSSGITLRKGVTCETWGF
jgi:hypothetical protein